MRHYLYKFTVMTSPCEVHIYHQDGILAQKLASDILVRAKALEKKYNFYDPHSLLSQINQRKVKQLDRETKELLHRAKLFYAKSEGVFDVTMGTLVASRRHASVEAVEEAVARLIPFVGVEHFKLQRDQIQFDNPYTQIDFGGLVKEYAVDQAVKILKKAKVTSALVNFGGDIYALGEKPKGEPFVIGIKNPHDPRRYIAQVPLKNRALTTSASYERNRQIEDRNYSHIIGTAPLQSRVISATVLAPSVVESGVFSTALMIKPSLRLPFEKLLIDEDLVIHR